MIRIKKGLALPIAGAPEQIVHAVPALQQVGVLCADYPQLDLQLCVAGGERVKIGQALFCARGNSQLQIVAAACGKVSVVCADDATPIACVINAEPDVFVEFPSFSEEALACLPRAEIVAQLLAAGMWPSLRARPFNQIADPHSNPLAIFVTAMDTQPLAPRADVVIEAAFQHFSHGLAAISRLTDGLVYVCKAPATYVPVPDIANIKVEEFAGPHPAGLAGTHIHFLEPLRGNTGQPDRMVWTINYQDVIAIGILFSEGRYAPERIVSLAGPQVIDTRLLRLRLGADINAMVAGQLKAGDAQLISGSVFAGRAVSAELPFLGRYHLQVTALCAQLGVANPTCWRWGLQQFSVLPIFLSRWLRHKRFRFSAEWPAAGRSFQPYSYQPQSSFKKIWPLRLLQIPLLQALQRGDVQQAVALGALELIEEDLALSTFVSAGKQDFGRLLRAVLNAAVSNEAVRNETVREETVREETVRDEAEA